MKHPILSGALSFCLCLPAFAEGPSVNRDTHPLGLALATPLAVIPTSANSPGRFGAYFKTRVVIHNLTSRSYTINALLCGPSGIVSDRSISMSPNQYLSYDNFLQDIFDYEGAGAVVLLAEISSLNPSDPDLLGNAPFKFSVTAEVYSDSPNGRYTTTVVNGIVPLVDTGTEAYSAGITVSPDQRLNVGVFNFGDATSSIQAVVHDSSGMVVQTIHFTAGAFSWQQKNVSSPVTDGYISWQIDSSPDTLPYLWAVSVDNRSNDGTLTWPIRPDINE